MVQKILSYIKDGKWYSGLEISEYQGNIWFSLLEVKKEKNELQLIKENRSQTLDETAENIRKNSPFILVINTSHVLTKIIGAITSENTEAIVNTAFPNLNFQNFYYEVVFTKSGAMVSISKKEYVDILLENLRLQKMEVTYFSLGPSTLEATLKYIDSPVVLTSAHEVIVVDNSIEEINNLQQERSLTYSIDNFELKSESLLGFAGILQFLGKNYNSSNFDQLNEVTKKDFEQKRIFDFGLRATLFFFLSLLFINFFVFDHYFKRVENLRASMEQSQEKTSELNGLKSVVTKKEQRFNFLNSTSSSRTSFYLDELGKYIPPSILLEKITYRPLKKQIREAKPIELEKNQVLITGTSTNGENFSHWIAELEKESWISSVETLDYDYISNTSSGFSIKILIDD